MHQAKDIKEFADKLRTCPECGGMGGGIDRDYLCEIIANGGAVHVTSLGRELITLLLAVCPNCNYKWRII